MSAVKGVGVKPGSTVRLVSFAFEKNRIVGLVVVTIVTAP